MEGAGFLGLVSKRSTETCKNKQRSWWGQSREPRPSSRVSSSSHRPPCRPFI